MTDFIIIPIIFYIVVVAAGLNLSSLRDKGWLFIIDTSDDPWYKFYSYYGSFIFPSSFLVVSHVILSIDFRATSWSALWATLPTQLAL